MHGETVELTKKYLTECAHHHIALTAIQQVNRHPVAIEPKCPFISIEDSLLLAYNTV